MIDWSNSAPVARFFERAVLPFFGRVSANPVLSAIRAGLVLTLPLVMLGSCAVLLKELPLAAYQNFMNNTFGTSWIDLLDAVWNGTFGIMAVMVLFSTSTYLARRHNAFNILVRVHPTIVGMVSLASLIVLVDTNGDWVPQHWIGVPGIFVAMVVAVLSSEVFLRFASYRKMRLDMIGGDVEFSVAQVFNAILPGFATVMFFAMIGVCVHQLFGVSIPEGFQLLLSKPFELIENSLSRALVYIFSLQSLWFAGIHGANALDVITKAIYESASAANIAAFDAGLEMPYIITKTFMNVFIFMGGSGATVCLAIALLLAGKASGQRRLAQASMVLGIFNINEILLFGLPVILNPIMLIPFVITPIVLCMVAYLAVFSGLVPCPYIPVEWTTPILLSGYISTGALTGSLLQLLNVIIGVIIYMPFVAIATRIREGQVKGAFSALLARACNIGLSSGRRRSLGKMDAAGGLAHSLVRDLELASWEKGELFLEYQPQVLASDHSVFSVEALLRWRHPRYGMIPAPITINLAEESGLIHKLGLDVFREACAARRRWLDQGIDQLITAVNISVLQLDQGFVPKIQEIIHKYGVHPNLLELEVTESTMLDPVKLSGAMLHEIHNMGVRIAIDDFGMGHSAIKYLKYFPVDILKIDSSLTTEITHNVVCEDIVASITRLCRSRNIVSIAEFVETTEQMEILGKHGCDAFQGYYFSMPLKENKCLDFLLKSKLSDVHPVISKHESDSE